MEDKNENVLPPTEEEVNLYGIYARLRSFFFASPLISIALVSLTVSTAVAVHGSRDDVATLSFILFSYVDLLALVVALRRFEQLVGARELTAEREARLKLTVWLLSAALIFGFSWKVSEVMPWPPAKAVIWMAAASVATAGFYALFVTK